jgi:hypothetical protein
VNAPAVELDTTWPSLPKVFTGHGLGMPARNPQAIRQRSGRPQPERELVADGR